MNKKSNLTRTALLAALLCGIAGPTFVGCKDYDDDINALQEQIDANKDAIAKLQELVNGGAIVKSVVSDNNGGIIITLSDGTEHHITKGDKGEQGEQGLQGEQGIQGLPGAEGKTPIFQITTEGMLQVRYSTEEEWQDLGKVTADPVEPTEPTFEFTVNENGFLCVNGKPTTVQIEGKIYLIEEEGVIYLNMPQMKDGKLEYTKIALPTSELFLHTVSSVNFVPFTTSGNNLNIYKLEVLDDKTFQPIADKFVRATPSQLRFRVSPSTAVLYNEETKKGDYKVIESMDYEELKSRAKEQLFSATNARVEEDGFLYVDFGFDAAKVKEGNNYTLALALNDLNNKDRVVYSDYIVFTAGGEKLENIVYYQEKEEEMVAVDLQKQRLEWKKGATLDLSTLIAGIKENDNFNALTSYGFEPTLSLVYAGAEKGGAAVDKEKKYVSVNGMVVTLEDATFQTYDAELTFDLFVKIGEDLVNHTTVTVKVTDFEMEQVFDGLYANTPVNNFIGNPVEVKPKFDAATWNGIETFFMQEMESVNPTFTVKKDGKDIADYSTILNFATMNTTPVVNVLAGAKAGEYEITATWVVGKKTATSTFTITVIAPVLDKTKEYWDNEGNLTVRADKDGKLTADLDLAFVIPTGTKVAYATESKDITIDGDGVIALTAAGAKKLAIGGYLDAEISYQLINATTGVEITEKVKCNVRFHNPIVSMAFAKKAFSMNDGGNVEAELDQLAIDLKVMDRSSGSEKLIISKSNIVTDEYLNENEDCDGVLASTYGVTEITYTSTDSRLTITNGVATWANNGAALAQPVNVKVKVTIANNWKTIEDEIVITIQPNK